MNVTINKAENIKNIFKRYCEQKNYQYEEGKIQNGVRLDISDLNEKANVVIYNTGAMVPGGRKSSLKDEIERLKNDINSNPQQMLSKTSTEVSGCVQRYTIIKLDLRESIKSELHLLGEQINIFEKPEGNADYRATINRNNYSLTITQYINGTLLLQGKNDILFHDTCDLIEQIANPAEDQVVARFISKDEEKLKIFAAKYSPQILVQAEDNMKNKLGAVYGYIEEYDRKYFIASECLYLTEIPLPEYSALVMPSSKAFEGFAKKLLVNIGFYEKEHFKLKPARFDNLTSKKHDKRIVLCKMEIHAGTYLDRISVDLDRYRNFMMHSDDSDVTKLEDVKEAEKILEEICKETKEIFKYFNKYFLS